MLEDMNRANLQITPELLTTEPDTNIIIHEILYRYDASEMNDKIYFLNENIRIMVNDYRLRKSVLLYAILLYVVVSTIS